MPGRRWVRRKPAAVVLCLALLGALALAGCSSSTQYLSSGSDHTYFKAPAGWKFFGEQAVVAKITTDLSPQQQEKVVDQGWRTAFDASPRPSLDHFLSSTSSYPTGYAVVSPLTAQETDAMSDATLRNQFFGVDDALNADRLTMLSYAPVNMANGIHGLRLTARLTPDPDSPAFPQQAVTFEQVAMTDQARTKVYAMVVVCKSTCFEKNQDRIDGVFDSWTVKDG
jgi:hypothetical protein